MKFEIEKSKNKKHHFDVTHETKFLRMILEFFRDVFNAVDPIFSRCHIFFLWWSEI